MGTSTLARTRDELILALDLYFRCPEAQSNNDHLEIHALSEVLRSLPIYPKKLRTASFRNPNGVYMKLMNFRAYDERKSGVGLRQGGRLERVIWDEFAPAPQLLSATATAILGNAAELEPVLDLDELALPEVAEGGILYRVHRQRERKPKIIAAKKRSVLEEQNALRCEVCGFDFAEIYGLLGDEFAECHHTKPVASMRAGDTTKLKDLSIVCANCHRMLHRGGQLLSIETLRRILADEAKARQIKRSFGTGEGFTS